MNDDDILSVIAHRVAEKTECDPKTITASSRFSELGLGSMEVIEMLFDVEEDLNVKLEDDDGDIAGDKTVGDLVNALKKALQRSPEQHAQPKPPHHGASHGKHS